MTAYAREALTIDGALRSAIAANELKLVYQSIVTADGRQSRKVEALLRWHSAQLGMVPPDRFIPVAEDSELIVESGHWVLQAACRQLAQWQGEMGELIVSINVSAKQLLDPGFTDQVRRALDAHGLPARRLEPGRQHRRDRRQPAGDGLPLSAGLPYRPADGGAGAAANSWFANLRFASPRFS